MRMDRYSDIDTQKEEKSDNSNYSRVDKNRKIYDDIYKNNSYVSLDDFLDEDIEKQNEQTEKEEEIIDYEEKNYSVNDYLLKARERFKPDEEKRNLDDDFLKGEDKISKLIASIDEKDQNEDLFSDLIGDNSETMIDGQLTKEEVLETTTYEEYTFDTTTNSVQLSKVLGNETITNLKLAEEKNNEGFQDIELFEISRKKKRFLAIAIFVITLLMLIGVVIFIVIPKI